jgi:hypothetical protein
MGLSINPHRHRALQTGGGGSLTTLGTNAGAAVSYGDLSSDGVDPLIENTTATLAGSIGTNNANDTLDSAAYIVLNKIIRAKDA